jgi:hypothetical protein
MKRTYLIRKAFKGFFLLFLCVLGSFSCQKAVNLDSNSIGPFVIIEGSVTDQPGSCMVKLSRTVDSLETIFIEPITGAQVKINDDAGNYDTLVESTSGIYISSCLQGVPGRNYTLTVEANGKVYTASSVLPSPVGIEAITLQGSGFTGNKELEVYYNDPAEILNYYRVIESINGTRLDNFQVTDDRLLDGDSVVYPISSGNENKLVSGDIVTISLESIDKVSYEYFKEAATLDDKSSLFATPATNLSNGARGYFSACSVRSRTIIVP